MECIDWYHFRNIIERNKKPWRSLKYYRSSDGFENTISICDFSMPKRVGVLNTGHAESDWYRDSYVCNAGWLDGFIPVRSTQYVYNNKLAKWEKKPIKGAIDVLKELVKQDVCGKTREVDDLINSGYWRP